MDLIQQKQRLIPVCFRIRKRILEMVGKSPNDGHLGGALSTVEILAALFLVPILRFNPKRPDDPARDIFVLSKGHASAALYAVLAEAGLIEEDLLKTYRHNGSKLQGHPHLGDLPWIDYSGGVLGGGPSYAHGICAAAQSHTIPQPFVICLIGDGECDEGQVWEALGTISHQYLKGKRPRLCIIVDWNKAQLDGSTFEIKQLNLEELFSSYPLPLIQIKSRYWINGHDFLEIIPALEQARNSKRPSIIIADTLKGRGVRTMEQGGAKFHGGFTKDFTLEQALAELEEVQS